MQIEFHADEEWVELPQDARFLVSTWGRLYDTHRRRLVPYSGSAAHPLPAWSIPDRRLGARTPNRYIRAAQAVLAAFVGSPRERAALEFVDGDPQNVRLDNLRWAQ